MAARQLHKDEQDNNGFRRRDGQRDGNISPPERDKDQLPGGCPERAANVGKLLSFRRTAINLRGLGCSGG